ncbi:MAG: DUF4282 domain-containing protein [Bacteroidota bacterium]|nr:DUF4282 domain-containing protein [Bacteroidota bacterium]
MNEFWSFEKMITPTIIKILFWIGIVLCVIIGILVMTKGDILILGGLLIIILGPIVWRVYCELLMVIFSINDHLRQIKHNTAPPSQGM